MTTRAVRRLVSLTAVLSLAAAAALTAPARASDPFLPLGDGHTSTTTPQVGWIYACRIMTGGGGAVDNVPWITGSIWYPGQKPAVSGAHTWSDARVTVTTATAVRTIATNSVPTNATTGTFPIPATDPAYQYDRNPNTVTAKAVSVAIPRNPTAASTPGCLSLGTIGYATNGVAIFNGLDGENRDAVAHEIQDTCDGHPERTGQYHYHNGSACLLAKTTGKRSTLIGYALDGYGIYVERDPAGNLLKNSALDVCHGRTSTVLFNGKKQKMYHYVITAEYPYTLGCYHGTPIASTMQQVAQSQQPSGGGTGSGGTGPGGTPPSGAPGGPRPSGQAVPPPPGR